MLPGTLQTEHAADTSPMAQSLADHETRLRVLESAASAPGQSDTGGMMAHIRALYAHLGIHFPEPKSEE